MLDNYWADLLDPKDPLFALRQQGWKLFQEIGLPRPKQEAFQYLTKKLEFPKPAPLPQKQKGQEGELLFVDGYFQAEKVAAPLICLPLDQAIRSYGIFLQNRIAKQLKEETDPFAALNLAFQGKGAFLYVPPKCKAALHLKQLFTAQAMSNGRIQIYLGRGSELILRQTAENLPTFSNTSIDLVLDEGARCFFQDQSVGHFQSLRATLKRDSHLKVLFLGEQLRHSLKVQLAEENSEVELYGLCQLAEENQSHVHVTVEHMAPHTRSRQHFKSVLKNRSRFSFEGKIYVHSEAQKTEAYQLNNNLILSDAAAANAKPNLEIFADDVKASHGATVGQLDAEQLFYLRSRGLPLEEARDWLIQGFCKEILDHAR
jgi:Fe-S cluster assembly protein SufD